MRKGAREGTLAHPVARSGPRASLPPMRLPPSARLTLTALVLAAGPLAQTARAQWTRVEGVPAAEVGAVLASGDTVYAGGLDAVYVSPDGGATWARSAPVPDGFDSVWSLAVYGQRLFAGAYGGVLESADGGATWRRRTGGLEGPGARVITALAVHGGLLYAGTSGAGVFRLDLADPDAAWVPHSEGLPGNVDAVSGAPGRLVAGASANGYVYVREDGAPAWTEYAYVPFDPFGPQMYALAMASGALLGGSSHGLFRSADGGRTWARTDLGVGTFGNVRLTVGGGRAYALATRFTRGTFAAVSDDAGRTWQVLEEIPGAVTYSVAVAGGRLFAGRPDGLWARPLYPLSAPSPGPPTLRILSSAPNPFTASVLLTYELTATADVTLSVYDPLGRRVATLAAGLHRAGRHEVVWAPGGAAGGVYVARLTGGGPTLARRLIAVR